MPRTTWQAAVTSRDSRYWLGVDEEFRHATLLLHTFTMRIISLHWYKNRNIIVTITTQGFLLLLSHVVVKRLFAKSFIKHVLNYLLIFLTIQTYLIPSKLYFDLLCVQFELFNGQYD